MVVSWLAFPLLAIAVSFGCGLLLERAGGWRMPGVVVTGMGLALLIVVPDLLTESTTLAPATPWVLLGLAVLGYGMSVPRLRQLRLDPWMLGLGIVLLACFAAPFLLSDNDTFGGYGVIGDPTFHFIAMQELLAHGHRSLGDLPYPTSTGAQLISGYLTTDYPFGSDLAVGALRPLTDDSISFVYSPFIAFVLTLGGLTLFVLLEDLVGSRPLRAVCAFIAAQAGLAYSFFLVSSIKELTTTWATALLVVLVIETLRRPPSVRALIPVAVMSAVEIDVLAIPGVPWIVPPLLALVAIAGRRMWGARRLPSMRGGVGTAVVIAVGAALAWPILRHAVTSYTTTSTVLTSGSGSSYGDLFGSLNLWQILGIWPVGDFRTPLLLHTTLVHVLLWIAAASAVGGAAWTLARRAWGLLLLLLGNGLVALVLIDRATPYAASKVEAILSITAVLAAMLGAVALSDLVHPVAGWLLAAVIGLGVLWTNDKSLRVAPLAPQGRFDELAQIEHRFPTGAGPTFENLWDSEYPAFYLFDMGPQIQHIFYEPPTRRGVATRTANELQIPWDPNDLMLSFMQTMRTMVMARSPTVARPPADFHLVLRNHDYDVYRRSATPTVLAHIPVEGSPLRHGRPLACRAIKRLGRHAARRHAELAYAPRLDLASAAATRSNRPASWPAYSPQDTPAAGGIKLSAAGGNLYERIRVPHAGRYTVWIGGELTQKITIEIDDHRVGAVSGRIGPGGLFTIVGSVRLRAGVQEVMMHRDGRSRFRPVSNDDVLGSLVLTRNAAPAPARTVPASRASSLCGTRMQWLEIVR